MTQIKVKVNWNVSVNPKEFREYLLEHDRLKPYEMVVGTKYAEYLEFGTGPAQHREGIAPVRLPWMTDEQYFEEVYKSSEFYRSITDWVRRKAYPGEPRLEQFRIAYRIYGDIARNGLRARPFWRPAFYWMCENMQKWFDEGLSTRDMVELMEHMVDDLLTYNINARIGSEYMHDTGRLRESLTTNPLTKEEAESALNARPMPRRTIRGISDEEWERRSREQGKNSLW